MLLWPIIFIHLHDKAGTILLKCGDARAVIRSSHDFLQLGKGRWSDTILLKCGDARAVIRGSHDFLQLGIGRWSANVTEPGDRPLLNK